ncbi:MAG TPA: hypothetical protein VIG66_02370 [Noviherbaspirillum sp.]
MNSALGKKLGGLVLAGLALLAAGCDRPPRDAQETGPAERTGEKVDQALSNAGGQLNELAERAGQNLEKFGARLQAEAREAQQQRNQASGASGTEGHAESGSAGSGSAGGANEKSSQ